MSFLNFLIYLTIFTVQVLSLDCTYGVTEIDIPFYQTFILMPPQCDYTPTLFTVTGTLPSGIKVDSESGGINGFTSENGTSYDVVIEASVGLSKTNMKMKMTIIMPDKIPRGINVYFVKTTDRKIDPNFMKNFLKGKYDVYINHANEIDFNCNPVKEGACPLAYNIKVFPMYNVWFFGFYIQDDSYSSLSCDIDDEVEIYIDGYTDICSKGWQTTVTCYTQLTKGYHFGVFLALNSETIAKTIGRIGGYYGSLINQDIAFSIPPPFQFVDWRTTDLVFVEGQPQTLTPRFTGIVKSWISNPPLPDGLKFALSGQITGAATSTSQSSVHRLTSISINMNRTFDIYMRVVPQNKENMIAGLDALYYSIPGILCEYTPIDPDTIPIFRRIDEIINRKDEVSFWEGLNGKFISSFAVHWTGLLSVPESAVYTIYITVTGGARLEILTQIIQSSICTGSTVQGSVALEKGLTNIELYYWIASGDSRKSLNLEWSYLGMGREQIPDSNFVHIPRYSFAYKYETASYIKGLSIPENCPIFNSINPSEYNEFSYYPELPSSLLLDPDTHCIKGIINAEPPFQNSTYFTITANGGSYPIHSRMTLSYDSYEKPISITYQPILCRIGEYISAKPVIIASQFVVESVSVLPKGLNLNTMTGEIYGTPTESTTTIILVSLNNAVGSLSGSVGITIQDCLPELPYFLQFKYITGSGTGLGVSISASGFSVYFRNDHTSDSYYELYKCISYSELDFSFTLPTGRSGSFAIYQRGNLLSQYGEYSVGKETLLKISLLPTSNKPSFKYSLSNLHIATGEYVSIFPQIISSTITKYEIIDKSTLPEGLFFNETNGLISGVVGGNRSGDTGIITIKAYNNAIESDLQHINYQHSTGCLDSKILLNIYISGGFSGPNMTLILTRENGEIIYSLPGVAQYKSIIYAQCVDPGIYIFQYGSSSGEGWRGSYVLINNRDTLLQRIIYPGGTTFGTFKFLLIVPIGTNDYWKYSSNFVADWKNELQEWNEGKSGQFLRNNEKVSMYYQKEIDIPNLNGISRYEIRVTTDTGIVGYINGKELFRRNMNINGEISDSDYATSSFSKNTNLLILGLTDHLRKGINLICFETHKAKTTQATSDPFTVRMSFFGGDSSCGPLVGTYLGADPSWTPISSTIVESMEGSEGPINLFDLDPKTKMTVDYGYSTPLAIRPLEIVVKLNNRALGMTHYEFMTSGDCAPRDPTSWELYGAKHYTDNDTIWELIDNRTEYLLPTTRYTSAFIPIKSTELFEGFKLKFLKTRGGYELWCDTPLIQFSDFTPSVCGGSMCVAEIPYPATPANETAKYPCSTGSLKYRTRYCYPNATWAPENITECKEIVSKLIYPIIPSMVAFELFEPIVPTLTGIILNIHASPNTPLPNGLILDSRVGILKGIPRVTCSNKNFTIFYDTPLGSSSTIITLTIDTAVCNGSNTHPNEFEVIRCDPSESGYQKRECFPSSPPTWSSWDKSGCSPGVSPRCDLLIKKYEFTINVVIQSIECSCLNPFIKASIDNTLPSGLQFNEKTGIISGTPFTSLPNTIYTIRFIGNDGGHDDVEISISVDGIITSCHYPYVNGLNWMLNSELILSPPVCDSNVVKFTANGLPPHFTIKTDGTISGTETTKNNYTIQITALNSKSNYTFPFPINILDMQPVPGLMGKFPVSTYLTENEAWNGVQSGTIEYEWALIPNRISSREGYFPITFGTSVVRDKGSIWIYQGLLLVPKEGEWEFTMSGGMANINMYLDDMTEPKKDDWYGVFTTTLTQGLHDIGILIRTYDQGSYYNYKLFWRFIRPDAIEEKDLIPDENYMVATSLLRIFNYPASEFIFIVGNEISAITPDLQGDYTTIIPPKNFPDGLIFTNGIISGTPKTAIPRTKYTIRCESNTGTIDTVIYITTLTATTSNLLKGLSGKYYTSISNIECTFSDPTSNNAFSLKYERIVPTYYHPPSNMIWNGLTGAFYRQFIVRWDGFLDVPESGLYNFLVSGEDGVKLIIGSVVIELSSCGFTAISSSASLTEGLNPLTVFYWKTHNSEMTSISIKWSKSSGTIIKLQEIPESNLYHTTISPFTYSNSRATYIENVPIFVNDPIFYQTDKSKYTIFTSSPLLPSGLLLNTVNGSIYGTPKSPTINTLYVISATATDKTTLTVSISIGVDPHTPPRNLVYENIKGNVGSSFSVTPSLDNAVDIRFFTKNLLPIGFQLDSSSGVLSGTAETGINTKITVYCSNPSGEASAEIKIEIVGCGDGNSYLKFLYSIGSPEVYISLIDSNKTVIVEENNTMDPFTSKKYEGCIKSGVTTLEITNKGKFGGSYLIYNSGELLKNGVYDDITRTVTFTFNTLITLLKITDYSIPAEIFTGFNYKLYPTIEGGVSKFSVGNENTLPDNFVLDSSLGTINCKITSTSIVSFNIIGTNHEGTITPNYLINIQPKKCPFPVSSFHIVISNTDTKFATVLITKPNGDILLNYDNFPPNFDNTYFFCDNSSYYNISTGHTGSLKWEQSKIEILLNGILIKTLSHSVALEIQNSIIATYSFVRGDNEWEITEIEPVGGWYNEYIFPPPDDWNIYLSSNFPVRIGITRYYRTTFNFNSPISDISALQLLFTFDSGIICYLNGNEFYRRNLPMTGVIHNSYGKRVYSPPRMMRLSVGPHLIEQGVNILAIEVHKHSDSLSIDPLDILLLPLLNDPEKCIVNTISSLLPITMDFHSDFPVHQWHKDKEGFDFDNQTKWCSIYTTDCELIRNFVWKWPLGQGEFMNNFVIVTDILPQRDPYDFTIYGTYNHEEPEWIKLRSWHEVPEVPHFESILLPVEDNIRSFEGYRLEVNKFRGCVNGNMEDPAVAFAEFLSLNCDPIYCFEMKDDFGTWKTTIVGNLAFLPCPSGMYGFKERLCENKNGTGTFAPFQNSCQANPGRTITYPPLEFYLSLYSDYSPIVDGGIDRYSINCALPSGIIFNTRYGRISGQPISTDAFETNCIVTGYIGFDSIQSSILITVFDKVCGADTDYPNTSGGKTARIPCEFGYEGLRTRLCLTNGTWDKEDRKDCKLLSPSINYAGESFRFNKNDKVILLPSIIGINYTLVLEGNLPKSLSFFSNNGEINGTALDVTTTGVDITIRISNDAGQSSTTITITILDSEAAILYSESKLTFYVGFSSSSSLPTIKNGVIITEISPIPPQNIILNSETGLISGIVLNKTSESTMVYYVLGNEKEKAVQSNPITIIVIQPKCPSESGTYPSTNAGETIETPCPSGQEGKIHRTCSFSKTPVWGDIIPDCKTIVKKCETDLVWPTTLMGKSITIDCASGEIGNRTRECLNINGQPYWGVPNTRNCRIIHPSIKYETSEMIIIVGEETTNRITLIDITTDDLNITPDLPKNMKFNSNGDITGIPIAEHNRTNYVISGIGLDMKVYTHTIFLTVTYKYATKLKYEQNIMQFYVGIEETSYKPPIKDGVIKRYSIDPVLPNNLQLSPDGKIYGTIIPNTIESNQTYIVSGEIDNLDSVSDSIKIEIIQSKCLEVTTDSIKWETTKAGETAHGICPIGSDGSPTRFCPLSKSPLWSDIDGKCISKVPSFKYSSNRYTFIRNATISNIVPINVINNPESYSYTCDIDLDGITFSKSNGIFSGKSNKIFSSTCSVSAENPYGISKIISLSITIINPQCLVDHGWPKTNVGDFANLRCDSNYGYQLRECIKKNETSAEWGPVDKSQCKTSDFNSDDYPSFVKSELKMQNVKGVITVDSILVIQMSYHRILSVPIKDIYVELVRRRFRFLESTTTINVYIMTTDVSSMSEKLKDTKIQNEIITEMKSSTKDDTFKDIIVEMTTSGKYETKQNNTGAIVGGVIGGIVFILLVILIYVCYLRMSNIQAHSSQKKGIRIGEMSKYATIDEKGEKDNIQVDQFEKGYE